MCLVDVSLHFTLSCQVPVHRAVLAASSPLLFELFERSADSHHNNTYLHNSASMYKLKDVAFTGFSYLLDYMYSGRWVLYLFEFDSLVWVILWQGMQGVLVLWVYSLVLILNGKERKRSWGGGGDRKGGGIGCDGGNWFCVLVKDIVEPFLMLTVLCFFFFVGMFILKNLVSIWVCILLLLMLLCRWSHWLGRGGRKNVYVCGVWCVCVWCVCVWCVYACTPAVGTIVNSAVLC